MDCALLTPQSQQASLSWSQFLATLLSCFRCVSLPACPPHPNSMLWEVVGFSIHHLPSVLNRSSHLIKPLQCYRVDINTPISPVKKLRHGGVKGVTKLVHLEAKSELQTHTQVVTGPATSPSLQSRPAYPHLKPSAAQWARVIPRAPPTLSGELDLLRSLSPSWDTNSFSTILDPEM